jgi:uncharacterized protein
MHYFIDGYNMLFRLLHDNENLQSQRESIIYDLNKKISLIKLDVSVVFDSRFQIGGRSRSHYDNLEILFSAEGETADEYILDEIKNASQPQQETVVTSDKKLAWQVRGGLAHTESVEEFILWLNRSYKNKLRQIKKDKPPPLTSPATSPHLPSPPPSLFPKPQAPLEAYHDYYAHTFESAWQEIIKEEEQRLKQESISSTPHKRTPRKARRLNDPFQTTPSTEEQAATEMERWLKVFEKRLSDPFKE